MPLIDIDGRAIDYELHPAEPADAPDGPARPALVFLHEGLGSIELWRGWPAEVRNALDRPRTLVYSRPGYGRSAPVAPPRSVDYMHHEALAVLPRLLDRFGIEAPILVGHSDGASIAVIHAGSGHAVRALVLIAPHLFVEACTVEAIAQARAAYTRGELRTRLARYHGDVDATFHGWNDVWLSEAFRAWNVEPDAGRISCPVLVVQGDADAYGSLAQVDALVRAAPSVRQFIVAGAGHAPHLEARAATTAAVVQFLGRVTGP